MDKVDNINLDVIKGAVELQSSIKSRPVATVEGSSFRGHSVNVTKQNGSMLIVWWFVQHIIICLDCRKGMVSSSTLTTTGNGELDD